MSGVVGRGHFWIALVGFVLSLHGFRLTRDALFGFGYGFFGAIMALCVVGASMQVKRQGSGGGGQ